MLDEVQRHKLVELQALLGLSDSLWTPDPNPNPNPNPNQALLGLSDSLWTPVGVLGFVLAAAS